MNKKVNPRRRPVTMTEYDIIRIKKAASDEAINLAIALFLTVMLDKHGYTAEDLQQLWAEVNNLSDSVAKGYVNLKDLRTVLEEEYGVMLSEGVHVK